MAGFLLNVSQLAERIEPAKTVLLLGAGASVESGGISGVQLARELSLKLAGEVLSDDLMEVSTILQNRYGRKAVVDAVVARIRPLQPAGGMLVMPEFDWAAIYSTNYDLLVERSYRRMSKPLTVIRSNHEWSELEAGDGPALFKIHGCVSGDAIAGGMQQLVLTENDYETYEDFREIIYRRLALDLVTKDVLVIGHSLHDPHLRKEIDRAAKLRSEQALPGRIYVLAYVEDRDRAQIVQNKGINVGFGGLDAFLDVIANQQPEDSAQEATTSAIATEFLLPTRLRAATTELAHARALSPNPSRLYHGGAASYPDIDSGLTIQRSIEAGLISQLRDRETYVLVIVGVAGVGKTTLARRILTQLDAVDVAYEHRSDFPFRSRDWIGVEKQLASRGLRGVVFIDDCPAHLSQLNRLVDAIGAEEEPALQVVATAERVHWVGRVKSPSFFAKGWVENVSQLSSEDVSELVNLVEREPRIHALVDRSFTRKPRKAQIRQLKNRCSADMFVCLKNIFSSDNLDAILLREYANLDLELQDIYRYVCAVESLGAHVHRQLIIRLLNVDIDALATTLSRLQGLVDEYDIDPRGGIYGLGTRHVVISRVISKYKFSAADEHDALVSSVIDNLNPSVPIELRAIRDLCNSEFGIQRLATTQRRVEMYERLIELAPAERIPWHRLIRELIEAGDLEAAADAIRDAETNAGLDPPIAGYKVRLEMERATLTEGILPEDRTAILRQAFALARGNLHRFPNDMNAVITFGRVAVRLVESGDPLDLVDDAISSATEAEERLLDPRLTEEIARLQRARARLARGLAAVQRSESDGALDVEAEEVGE
jgi:hypothetical protein